MAKHSSFRNRLEYAVALLLLWSLRILPRSFAERLGYGVARLLDLAMPKLRRIAFINLSFALPDLSRKAHQHIVEGVFQSIGRLLVAIARFPSLNSENIQEWIGYEGLAHYQAAKAGGRGVLIATAHFGNWELSAFAHALLTEPMHVMVRPLDNSFIDRLIEDRRASSGNYLIQKRDAARAVIKALRGNAPVGVLIDQNTMAAEGVFVDFFGKDACASSAFMKLAHHSQAAVVPGFALWHPDRKRYLIHFYPQLRLTGDVQQDTQQVHAVLEQAIREHPDQWLWIHRRWKTRPFGEPPLY